MLSYQSISDIVSVFAYIWVAALLCSGLIKRDILNSTNNECCRLCIIANTQYHVRNTNIYVRTICVVYHRKACVANQIRVIIGSFSSTRKCDVCARVYVN